jgi:hypothetical protein
MGKMAFLSFAFPVGTKVVMTLGGGNGVLSFGMEHGV